MSSNLLTLCLVEGYFTMDTVVNVMGSYLNNEIRRNQNDKIPVQESNGTFTPLNDDGDHDKSRLFRRNRWSILNSWLINSWNIHSFW